MFDARHFLQFFFCFAVIYRNLQFMEDLDAWEFSWDKPVFFSCTVPASLDYVFSDPVAVEGGADITLTCSATGEPPPNITWTKVLDNGSDSVVLFTGQQFALSNNRSNDGTYRCTVGNGIGSPVNHTARVTVNCEYYHMQICFY